MTDKILIQLSPVAVAKLQDLMRRFGETREDAMISRALGVLEVVKNYLASDGTLTIVDPSKIHPNMDGVPEAALVDIVFEKAKRELAETV